MARYDDARPDRAKTVLSKLSWVLSLTRLGLFSERVIRAFWPVWSLIFVVSAALMMGVQDAMSVEAVWSIGLICLAALLFLTWRGARQVTLPSRNEALIRLDDTLPGRPVQSLMDHPAMGDADPATAAIWRAHQTRMADRAANARPPKPNWAVSHLDPFGLRFTALLLLAVALLFGSVSRMSSVSAMAPGGATPSLAEASWEGWITPPSYTGLPTLYLNDQPAGSLELPENSLVTLRLYGEIGTLTVNETVSARVEVPSAADPAQSFSVQQEGTLEIAGANGRSWSIGLVPDHPPQLTTVGDVETSARGEMSLPFSASDDYEVASGTAVMALNLGAVLRQHGLAPEPEETAPVPMQLPLPIAGTRDAFDETLIDDFSAHAWAHLPVTLTLQVTDAAGQNSMPMTVDFDLPARRFFDPLANALVELRRDLLWSRENGPRVAQLMRAISHRPDEGIFRKDKDYLRLRTILRHLERVLPAGLPDEDRLEITDELWAFALELEEGDLDDALERMARAQERLAEAMKNGASQEEIDRLMQELREATQDYLRQLARRNSEDQQFSQNQQQPQNGMQMTQDDLQRMMDRIQELMEQGRMAEAQQALEEFQRLMENMRVTQGGQGQPSPGEQALDELGETLRNQQGLSDQAFRQLQEQFNPNARAGQNSENEGYSGGEGRGQSHDGTGGSGQGEGESGEGQEGQGLEGALADRQQALRQELERQRNGLPGQGTPEGDAAREALGRAGEAMDGAEEALRNQDLAEAIDQQSEAMEALREGMRSLGEALAQNQQQGGQEGQAQNSPGAARDPLGRNPGQQGMPGTEQGLLQGEDVYRRAQDLLEEIRRRAGEGERPELERNYLKRLLDRF
ncbi:TIGR02302 family protein [Cognatishimia maritima]|uniref:TIGR02302 family protein n=1 Tax=Cognatishimia maritima TaxID=870908 RepID=A0A1M5RV56_9RHOB|nr:TIGR02302 family protein [Cognatishimia maritima]SHH29713.1 TIGR02302 family protein [Cognatishimia maritima]